MALTMATSAGGAGPGAAADPAGAPALVDMTAMAVPIVDGDRIQGTLQVRLMLNATDDGAAAKATEAMPRLRAAALTAMLEFARLYASPFRPVDAERLSRELDAAVEREAPGAAQVLLVEVVARPA